MNIDVGISEDIGMRDRMEDEYAIYDRPEWEFFSAEVYDGHLGREAAQLAAEMLTPHFLDAWLAEKEKAPDLRRHEEELLREAYLATDEYIVYRRLRSGTAAATLHILGERFFAANTGDSRVILGIRAGARTLTLDHKPDLPEEQERIERLGGMVTHHGTARVMGFLAMSRALGDTDLKPFVTPEPRVLSGLLGRENDYAVLACDGVWDVLTPEEVIDLTRGEKRAQRSAEAVVRTAIDKGSSDNVTAIVLDLRRYTGSLKRESGKVLTVTDEAGRR